MKPGVYFGIPEAEYHAIPAVGSSALRDMLISPLDCWAKHVNPHRREKPDTAATLRGSAFHAMLLEGREAFEARYFPALNRDAFPDVLWSGDQLAQACASNGLTKSGTLRDRAARLIGVLPVERLGPLIEDEYEQEHAGKTELPAEEWDRIMEAAAVMEAAGILDAFKGGQPEVTIVYVCPITGLLRKARIDYLKPAAAFDLKTFSNVAGKELPTAIAHAFIYNRMHVQAVDYWHAIEQAKKQGLPCHIVNHSDEPETAAWPWHKTPHEYFMIFRQAGDVPNVAVRRVARSTNGQANAYWRAAEEDRALALREYKRHLDTFGVERPWAAPAVIEDFDDTLMPAHMIGG